MMIMRLLQRKRNDMRYAICDMHTQLNLTLLISPSYIVSWLILLEFHQ